MTFHSGVRGTIRATAGTVLLGDVMAFRPDGTVAQEVDIREDGTYVLDRLDAGVPYRIRVDAAGRDATGTLTQFATRWWGGTLTLPAETFTDGVDVDVTEDGVTEPRPDGTWRILGQLTKDGGNPPGWPGDLVTTQVRPDGTLMQSPPVTPHVERADGVFELRMQPGTYLLKALLWGKYQHEYYNDAVMREDATRIVLSDDNVTLRPVDLTPRASLSGRLVDEAGQPIAGVRVSMRSTPQSYTGSGTTTDANGRFSYDIGAGNWLVGFSDPQTRYLTEWYDDVYAPESDPPPDGTPRVQVRRDDVDLGDIALTSAGTISGTVAWDLADLGGTGVALFDLTGEQVPGIGESVYTSGDTYSLRLVPPGHYVVGFTGSGTYTDPEGDGEEATLRELYPGVHRWAEAQPVEVVGGVGTTGIDAHLTTRPLPDTSTVEIAGKVTDHTGRPEAGIRVMATSRETAPYQEHRFSRVWTDKDGHYEFTGLEPSPDRSNEYVLKFYEDHPDSDDGVVPRWSPGVEREEDSGTVTVPASGTVTFDTTVRRLGGIALAVDATTPYEPDEYSYATMSVVDLDGQVVAKTSSQHWPGRWLNEFEVTGIVPGQYLLRLDGDHFPTTWWPGVRSQAEAEPVEVPDGEVDRSLSMEIRVDAPPEPAPDPTQAPQTGPLVARIPPHVTGARVVGRTLTVPPGTWSLSGVDEQVEWQVDGTTIARGPSLALTPDLAGARIRASVTTTHAPTGQQVVTNAGTIQVKRFAPKLSLRVRPNPRRGRVVLLVSLTLPSPPGTPWSGAVTVDEGGPVLLTRTLDAQQGWQRIVLRKVPPGRHVYRVRIPGSSTTSARLAREGVTVAAYRPADRVAW